MKLDTKKALYSLIILCSFLIISIEGFNGSTLWNLAPLVLALVIMETIVNAGGGAWSALTTQLQLTIIGLVTGALIPIVFFHVTWAFDIAGAKTGSSTSGLIFLFIPIWAMLLGFIGSMVGLLLGKLKLFENK